MQRKPLGEARRLRYFSYICHNLLDRKDVDEIFFSEFLLEKIQDLNKKLKFHKRSTGILQTTAVLRNYISYCKWLNLLKKESNLLIPNGYTIFFGSIAKNENFSLSKKEKIAFFNLLYKKEIFRIFLGQVKIRSNPVDYINGDINEHRAETFLEWCIDLDVLIATSKKFGKYLLQKNFINFPIDLANKSDDLVLQQYLTKLLNKKIEITSNIDEDILWNEAMKSLYKTSEFTRSELDYNLYSALPMIMDLQVELILKTNKFMPINILNKRMEKMAIEQNCIFGWDYLSNGGFIKLE